MPGYCGQLHACVFWLPPLGEVVMPTETKFDDQCHSCFEDIRVDD